MNLKNIRQLLPIFFIILFLPHGASAHATPITYDPIPYANLKNAPEKVRIQFSERIEPSASDIRVFGPDGSLMNQGNPTLDSANPSIYTVSIKNHGVGTYTVSWQAVSADDGHFAKGAFSFSIGQKIVQNNLGQIQIQHLTSIPEAITMWIELMGQAFLLGTLIVMVGLRKRFTDIQKSDAGLEDAIIRKRYLFAIISGIALILIGSISYVVLKTFDLEQLRGTDFITTVQTFTKTVAGGFAVYRIILIVIFTGVFLIGKNNVNDRGKLFFELPLFALLILMTLDRARVSHAAATHFHPVISIVIHTIHLLAKEFWIGGLFALASIVLPVFKKNNRPGWAVCALITFSKLVSIAFGIAGATGLYIVWLDLKSPSNLFTTEWGSRFILLLIFAGVLFAVRLLHQFIIDRHTLRVAQGLRQENAKKILAVGRASILFELFIGLALLFVTSYLMITAPPYRIAKSSFEKQVVSQGEIITLTVHPYEPSQFLIVVTSEHDQKELSLKNLVVALSNEEKNIGPLPVFAEERFPGGYTFPKDALTLPGTWKIQITASRPESYDGIASFTIHYPTEIEAAEQSSDERSFGFFELVLVLAGLIILAASIALYSVSKKLQTMIPIESLHMAPREKDESRVSHFSFLVAAGFIGVLCLVWFLYNNILKTDFQKLCEKNGDFWLQSVPLRNAVALSEDTVTGCTLNIGLNHFADMREYQYFLRGATSLAELAMQGEQPIAGKPTNFSIALSEVHNGRKLGPVRDITVTHDRIMHVIIIGQDLKTFAHIHSEDLGPITEEMLKNSRFPFQYTFPMAGRYTIAVNYYLRARHFTQQFPLDVVGTPIMETAREDFSREKNINGYRIVLQTPPHIPSGKLVKLTYYFEKDGKPVQDFEPYLAAAMHVGIVNTSLQGFIHTHGEAYVPGSAFIQQLFQSYVTYHNHFVPSRFGPRIQVRVQFPRKGTYQIFSELQHRGKVILAPFMIRVE